MVVIILISKELRTIQLKDSLKDKRNQEYSKSTTVTQQFYFSNANSDSRIILITVGLCNLWYIKVQQNTANFETANNEGALYSPKNAILSLI